MWGGLVLTASCKIKMFFFNKDPLEFPLFKKVKKQGGSEGGSNTQLQDVVTFNVRAVLFVTTQRTCLQIYVPMPKAHAHIQTLKSGAEDGHLSFLGQSQMWASENIWPSKNFITRDPLGTVGALPIQHIAYWQKLNTVDQVGLLILTQVQVFILYSLFSFFFFISMLFVLHKRPHGREERAEAS